MESDRKSFDDKLSHILAAAASVFAAKGYHNATIRDVARSAGVSLSGLYYYVSSKEELLYLIQDQAFVTLLGVLQERLKGIESPTDRLSILVDNQVRYFVTNMEGMKILSHEADSLSGELFERISAKKRRLTVIASQILRDLHPESDLDLRVATFALFGMMNWLYTWYRPQRDVPVEALVEQMTRLFLHGFLGSDRQEDPSGQGDFPVRRAADRPGSSIAFTGMDEETFIALRSPLGPWDLALEPRETNDFDA